MGAPITYSVGWSGPEIIVRGVAHEVSCPTYHSGVPAVPSSGVVSIFSASNTAIVDAQTVTISNGVATYSLSSGLTSSLTPESGWRIEWDLVMPDGVHHVFRRDAALVFRRLYPSVSQADILKRYPDLERRKPASIASYQGFVDEAFAEIESRLIAEGNRPWLILSGSALREPHLHLTLSLIWRDLSEGHPQSQDWALSEKHEQMFYDAWKRTTFLTASPTTGAPDSASRKPARNPFLWL